MNYFLAISCSSLAASLRDKQQLFKPFTNRMNQLQIRMNTEKSEFRSEMNYLTLFSPLKVGPYQLQHRLVLAPLTRMRAEKRSNPCSHKESMDSFAPRIEGT
jgi:hypothetical protein